MALPESAWPGVFSVGATAFLGEQSAGTWTIALFDKVAGITATYKSATVRAWGSEATPNTNLVFTDEFKGSKVLTDTSGLDTVNAAAMTGRVAIDLNSGAASSLPGGQFVIAAGTAIENAIGGDGDDVLTGNAANNIFRGNRGNDTVDGGAGIDTAVFTGTRSGYTITVGGSTQVASKSGLEGTDTLVNVERLKFSSGNVALDVTGNAGTVAKIIGSVFGAGVVKSRPDFVGIGLNFTDSGMSYEALAALAIGAAGATTPQQIVNLLWTNVVGTNPAAADAQPFVSMLNNGMSVGALGVLASETDLNKLNINLVGLGAAGIDFI
jgi:Ca2+-binding RTX toxin-like protein